MLTQPGERIDVGTMCQTQPAHRALPRHSAGRRLPSWNGLLALGHDLAVRTGWTGQERTVSWTLSARPSAVAAARRVTAGRLAAWQLPEPAATAQQLAAELVADALRHDPHTIKLTLTAEDGLLRCEVERQGAEHAARCGAAALLERLACCWGAADAVVWFELRIQPGH
jgi:hypothetical protein